MKKGVDMILDGDLEGKFVFNTMDCIGKGKFGNIYRGRNVHTYEEVAIKTEHINALLLYNENQAYASLGVNKKRNHYIPGLPEIYYFNNVELHYMAMAMEMLGPSLSELLKRCGNKFSLKTVLSIAMQMITRIEHVHNCKLIHRDINPENMLIGRPLQPIPFKQSTENTVYLIDFAMAKTYIDPNTNEHYPVAYGVDMVGTYMFMSARCHLNIEQSRRDDLESLGYVLLYFMNGTLPWSEHVKDHNLVECVNMKNEITTEDLCDGLPEEFVKYFEHVKQLDYSETPDYQMLKYLFQSTYMENQYLDDNLFDWSKL